LIEDEVVGVDRRCKLEIQQWVRHVDIRFVVTFTVRTPGEY